MVAVLDGNAHFFEGQHGIAAQVRPRVCGGLVEETSLVQRLTRLGIFQVEVLDLRRYVVREPHFGCPLEVVVENPAAVGLRGLPVRRVDVAEHAGHRFGPGAPGQDLPRGRVGQGHHVGFAGARQALNG